MILNAARYLDEVTGMTLQQRRLLTVMQTPAAHTDDPVLWYGRGVLHGRAGYVCLVCDASAGVAGMLQHSRENCRKEYQQIIAMGRYLLAQGIHPFVNKESDSGSGDTDSRRAHAIPRLVAHRAQPITGTGSTPWVQRAAGHDGTGMCAAGNEPDQCADRRRKENRRGARSIKGILAVFYPHPAPSR